MNPLSSGIYLEAEHWNLMLADVIAKSPEEVCGFVAGAGNHSRLIIPITNILHDKFRFRMDPDEEFKAFIAVEEKGWEILGVYHSHPHGINRPSPSDFDQLTFPGIVYLIWYQNANDWRCRGYLMQSTTEALEVPVVINPEK
jgi:proteasome lid subunit RPN8/RPN11